MQERHNKKLSATSDVAPAASPAAASSCQNRQLLSAALYKAWCGLPRLVKIFGEQHQSSFARLLLLPVYEPGQVRGRRAHLGVGKGGAGKAGLHLESISVGARRADDADEAIAAAAVDLMSTCQESGGTNGAHTLIFQKPTDGSGARQLAHERATSPLFRASAFASRSFTVFALIFSAFAPSG